MAVDLALDFQTGDLVPTASGDFALRSGPPELEQRVHIALVIPHETWVLNPAIGSRVAEALQSPVGTAPGQIELAVHEALDAVEGVSVIDVKVVPNGARGLTVHIQYAPTDQVDNGAFSSTVTTIDVEGVA